MKHANTLFICLLATLYSFAQNVFIPDANFKAALVNNFTINTNADTAIQVSEAIAYTGGISVLSHSIADLTGIAAFVNITSLNCYNNQLTSLNVSANTALTTLTCSVNQLTSLNVSTNTGLTNIICSNNQLTSLNVSANAALSELYCSNNQLQGLNVSANTGLTILYCFINQLTSLDLSDNTALADMESLGNPNLYCIQVANVAAATANPNWIKDATTSYSINCGSLGVADLTPVSFSVYPNPADNTLYIDGLQMGDEWKVYNTFGQLLLSEKCMNTNEKTMDIHSFAKGVYVIRFARNTITRTIKLVKQ